jgi:hypothetical protein
MSTGIIVLQQAIVPEEPVLPAETELRVPSDTDNGKQPDVPLIIPPGLGEYQKGTFVRLALRMNRQQLFAGWNALINLVDKAAVSD